MPIVSFYNAAGKALKQVEVSEGTLLFDAAVQAGLPVASSCLKDSVCGKCAMFVLSGSENLNEITPHETKLLTKEKREPGERISCMVRVSQDCAVSTTYW